MSYEVVAERKARKALARLPASVYDRTIRAINDLADDPRPRHSLSLQGRCLRVGSYRVLHEVDDERREVFVAEVWHRQRDYR